MLSDALKYFKRFILVMEKSLKSHGILSREFRGNPGYVSIESHLNSNDTCALFPLS